MEREKWQRWQTGESCSEFGLKEANMKLYINEHGQFNAGDKQPGEREATPEEIIGRSQSEWRSRANYDFSARKELYLKNIAYADAMGRDSTALQASLLKEETSFKDRILKINQGVNPYEAAE